MHILKTLSITIATISISLGIGLQNGVYNATFDKFEKKTSLDEIIVQPKQEQTNLINIALNNQKNKITDETIEKIEKIEGIKSISPEIQFLTFSSIEGSVLGMSLTTDAIIYGVKEDLIKEEIKKEINWENNKKEPIPAIIPRQLLDLYNITIAYPQNLPTLTEKQLIGKKLTLYPNKSTFFETNTTSDKIELEVVGFSNKVSLVGVTIPFEKVQELNKKYTGKENNKYIQLHIKTESEEKTKEIAEEIEKNNLTTTYLQKNFNQIEDKLKLIKIILTLIIGIIIISSSIGIISINLSEIKDEKKEIGLLRALGATKTYIKIKIIKNSIINGIIGGILGIITGKTIGTIINKLNIEKLETIGFTNNTIFIIETKTIIITIIGGILLSIFTSIIPAIIASNADPSESLK